MLEVYMLACKMMRLITNHLIGHLVFIKHQEHFLKSSAPCHSLKKLTLNESAKTQWILINLNRMEDMEWIGG